MAETYLDEIDPSDVDWRATAQEMQREITRLARLVAELEAGDARTEWGVRSRNGETWNARDGERDARRHAAASGRPLVRREVRTGPWVEVAS